MGTTPSKRAELTPPGASMSGAPAMFLSGVSGNLNNPAKSALSCPIIDKETEALRRKVTQSAVVASGL